jgi:hypothetical protein
MIKGKYTQQLYLRLCVRDWVWGRGIYKLPPSVRDRQRHRKIEK